MNQTEESDHWDWVARDSTRIDANVYGDLDLDECLSAITSQIVIEGWVLDLGCGPGRLTRALAMDYPKAHLVGVDSSQLMIGTASQLAPEVHWVWNNGRDLSDFAAPMFDAAYSMTMFQHIPDDAKQGYLRELHRVLKPGGKFRVQFVFEAESGPLSFPTSVKDMLTWADAAGFRETDVNLGRIHKEWCWLTLLRS